MEKGEIKALQIEKVLIKTTTDYCVIAKVRLQSEVNAFDAKLKINYQLKGKRWQFEYVVSLGMDIVKTGKYNNFLSIEIDECGIFGIALWIRNKSSLNLYCAGYVKCGDEKWKKFLRIVQPHDYSGVGGNFSMDNDVTDYKIVFIERCD